MNRSQQHNPDETPHLPPEDIGDREELLSELSHEICRFETFFTRIKTEKIPIAGYLILVGTIALNLFYLVDYSWNYMIVWILASLYFYLLYPLLIPALIIISFLTGNRERKTEATPKMNRKEVIQIIQPRKNYSFIIRLAIRFFLLSIMPLTWGMVLFYSISLVFAIVLNRTGDIPGMTCLLISVQCLGIIIFYLNLWILKHHYFLISRLFLEAKYRLNRVKILLIAFLGTFTVLVATGATIILIVAMLLPGFTTSVFIAGSGLIDNRANTWILFILISMFVWMQYLQSVLSRKIPIRFGTDLLDRLKTARDALTLNQEKGHGTQATDEQGINTERIRSLLAEARIHTASRTKLAGLFPVYTIGVDLKELIRSWNEMERKRVFFWK